MFWLHDMRFRFARWSWAYFVRFRRRAFAGDYERSRRPTGLGLRDRPDALSKPGRTSKTHARRGLSRRSDGSKFCGAPGDFGSPGMLQVQSFLSRPPQAASDLDGTSIGGLG